MRHLRFAHGARMVRPASAGKHLLLREGQPGLEAVFTGGDDVAAHQPVSTGEQIHLHPVRYIRVKRRTT